MRWLDEVGGKGSKAIVADLPIRRDNPARCRGIRAVAGCHPVQKLAWLLTARWQEPLRRIALNITFAPFAAGVAEIEP
jgi:hypothetical protein